MVKKFQTLFEVKSSLICLYLALTFPLPFISSEKLKIFSILTFVIGIFLIINVTSDYVETSNKQVSYRTSFISQIFGKRNWEVNWKDIKLIKSLPTSQGSKVYYLITNKEDNFLIPQRLQNLEDFIFIISRETGLNLNGLSYITPLWTYKFLTFLSLLMIIGEIFAFLI